MLQGDKNLCNLTIIMISEVIIVILYLGSLEAVSVNLSYDKF